MAPNTASPHEAYLRNMAKDRALRPGGHMPELYNMDGSGNPDQPTIALNHGDRQDRSRL